MIEIGDYVGQAHPSSEMILKKGIVVESKKTPMLSNGLF